MRAVCAVKCNDVQIMRVRTVCAVMCNDVQIMHVRAIMCKFVHVRAIMCKFVQIMCVRAITCSLCNNVQSYVHWRADHAYSLCS